MANSQEMITLLNVDSRGALSDFSIQWSTSALPAVNVTQRLVDRRRRGRRQMTIGALGVASMFPMHCHVAAATVTGGFFIFLLLLVPSIILLANVLRHFEVFLGQWSISGPGRAFRMLPSMEGLGMAICAHVLLRGILCTAIAALSFTVLYQSVSDNALPIDSCRDFNLNTYKPSTLNVTMTADLIVEATYKQKLKSLAGVSKPHVQTSGDDKYKNKSFRSERNIYDEYEPIPQKETAVVFKDFVCKEKYSEKYYPPIILGPAYNYFFIELARYGDTSIDINWSYLISISIIYLLLLTLTLFERFSHGRIAWSNMQYWICTIPWIWTAILTYSAFEYKQLSLRHGFRMTHSKNIFQDFADALLTSLYIHSAGLGTEIIHGKGLNYFAGGHVDDLLNGENIMHSLILIFLTCFSSIGVTACALADYSNEIKDVGVQYSTLWVLPLYGECMKSENYRHLMSALLYFGVTLSYMIVASMCFKTAIHIIFEYRSSLIVYEHYLVSTIFIVCMIFTFVFTIPDGVLLLDCMESLTTRITMPTIVVLETVAILYVYRSHDFISDMNLATEFNTCTGRLQFSWNVLPFVVLVIIITEIVYFAGNPLPAPMLGLASISVLFILLLLPIRALFNWYKYFPGAQRQDRAKPGAQRQDTAKPGAQRQDTAKPGAQRQDTAKPGAQRQDTAKPGAQRQGTAKPGAQRQGRAK